MAKYADLDACGVDYKKVLPPTDWPKAEAFCRVIAFLRKNYRGGKINISFSDIKDAVNYLLARRLHA